MAPQKIEISQNTVKTHTSIKKHKNKNIIVFSIKLNLKSANMQKKKKKTTTIKEQPANKK